MTFLYQILRFISLTDFWYIEWNAGWRCSFWPWLFGVLHASNIYVLIYFPIFWEFSVIVSVDIIFMAFVLSFDFSLISVTVRWVFFASSNSWWVHCSHSLVVLKASVSSWSLMHHFFLVLWNAVLTSAASAAHTFNIIFNLMGFWLKLLMSGNLLLKWYFLCFVSFYLAQLLFN